MELDKFGIRKIYPTVGLEWFNKWDNKHPRTLAGNTWDPDDSRFGFHNRKSDIKKLVIDGNGKASLPGNMKGSDSQRLFVNGPWTNTEMTVYTRWRTRCWETFQLRARGNHHGTKDLPYGFNYDLSASCGFGNYEAIWGGTSVRNSVEVIHDLYSKPVSSKTSPQPKENIWIGHKFITRNVNNTVVTEAWSNFTPMDQNQWIKETEFTYNGTNVHIDPTGKEAKVKYCLDSPDKIAGQLDKNTLWLKPGKWCWIRINGGDDMDLKYFSVREI